MTTETDYTKKKKTLGVGQESWVQFTDGESTKGRGEGRERVP